MAVQTVQCLLVRETECEYLHVDQISSEEGNKSGNPEVHCAGHGL